MIARRLARWLQSSDQMRGLYDGTPDINLSLSDVICFSA